MFGNTYRQKGTYNTSFVLAALASCMFQITIQDLFHTFKVLSGTALLYLSDLIQKYIPEFTSKGVKKKLKTMYGEKSFQRGSHSQGNIIFQDISRTKSPFSRIMYTRFKGNKLRYVQKAYNIYSMYDRLLTFLRYSLLLTISCLFLILTCHYSS